MTYVYRADGRVFYVVRRRTIVGRRGYPWRWFSWEQVDEERQYLASGVRTKREALEPINKICGITG